MREIRVVCALAAVLLCASPMYSVAGEKSGSRASEDVVVLQQEESLPAEVRKIKTIELDGRARHMTYHEIIEEAKVIAFKEAANLIKIEDKTASYNGGPVQKLVATLYRADDVRPFEKEWSWRKHRRLSWDDFRGPVPEDADEVTAAATFCGIGFETNTISTKQKVLKIKVYNTFYSNHSWVRPEERTDAVLAHEQGHFDLCELYTRKLRQRMSHLQLDVHNLKPVLRGVYEQLQGEYKKRQSAYEDETEHGVNLPQQRKWQQILEQELSDTEMWSES